MLGPLARPGSEYVTSGGGVGVNALDYVGQSTGEMRVRNESFAPAMAFTDTIDQLTVRVRYDP